MVCVFASKIKMIISGGLEQTIYLKMTKIDHWVSKTTLSLAVWDIKIKMLVVLVMPVGNLQ